MKKITVILMLIFSIAATSQNKFTETFKRANIYWEGLSEMESIIHSLSQIETTLKPDKEKVKFVLTVQMKSIKWRKFRQRAVLRRAIRKLYKL